MHLVRKPALAAEALAAGHLAALPTETVYGLGGRADDPQAIARIYAVKGRPADHPLIVHLLSNEVMGAWARTIPDYAATLASTYWPGPLTLVLPRTARAGDHLTAGQDSVALRVAAHPAMAQVQAHLADLVHDEAVGIAAPSANRFGRVSPTTAEHVRLELAEYLAEQDVVLDAGPCQVGIESTIVDCTIDHPRLLRPGAISAEQIEELTGLTVTHGSPIRASGTLASHYAPLAQVTLIADVGELVTQSEPRASASIGFLALADIPTPVGVVRLASPANAQDYATVLYAALREADALGLERIIAIPPPATGIGLGIRDRLMRAAHPHDRRNS